MACGLLLFVASERYLSGTHYLELAKASADALVIAGVLGVFVEPVLKRKLLRDAAEGMFEHILGFDLEPAIKERLKRIAFGQRLYVRDAQFTFALEPVSETSVKLACSVSYEIRNASASTVRFLQHFASDRSDFAKVHEFSLRPNNNSRGYVKIPIRQVKEDDDPETDIWTAEPVEIMPHAEGGPTYRFGCRFECLRPLDSYYNYVPSLPLIGVTVRIEAPEEFLVSVSRPAVQSGDQWYFSEVVMNGEKVTVRWHKKKLSH